MDRAEHSNLLNQLLGMVGEEQHAAASEILTNLITDYDETLTAQETQAQTAQRLQADNETLRKVNSQLFLKVGNKVEPQPAPTPPPEPPEQTYKFEDLFNEKGELI